MTDDTREPERRAEPAQSEGGPISGGLLPVSVCIIAHDEGRVIEGCLRSVVARAAEVIVLDAGSTDDTATKIRSLRQTYPQITLVSGENDPNLNANKMRAFERATQTWVLSLDADEQIPEPLWQEIAGALARPDVNGYWIPRRNHFVGQWLRHGDFYPDRQRRLFRRGFGRFPMLHPHEYLDVDGESGTLAEPFLHHSFPNVQTLVRKITFYSQFVAEIWAERGVRWTPINHLRYGVWGPSRAFVRRYFGQRGYRDGFAGFFVAFILALHDLLAYAAVKELTTPPSDSVWPAAGSGSAPETKKHA